MLPKKGGWKATPGRASRHGSGHGSGKQALAGGSRSALCEKRDSHGDAETRRKNWEGREKVKKQGALDRVSPDWMPKASTGG